jgi:hypothetical protein
VFAAFMAEAELNGLIDRDIEQFRVAHKARHSPSPRRNVRQ